MIPRRYRGAPGASMARVSKQGRGAGDAERVEMSALRVDGSEFPVEMILWRTAVGTETFYGLAVRTCRTPGRARPRSSASARPCARAKLTAMGSLLAGVATVDTRRSPSSWARGPAGRSSGQALAADQRVNEDRRALRPHRAHLPEHGAQPAANRSEVSLNDLATAAIDMLGYALRSHCGIDHRARPAAGCRA